jgi:hypothetical protein
VLAPPKIEFAKSSLQFDSVNQVGHLVVRNSGTRLLTLDLPELRSPFKWLQSERHLELACAGELANLAVILDSATEESVKHVYWLKTNGVNVSDSTQFVLEAREASLGVVELSDIPGLKIQGTKVTVSGAAGSLETFTVLGQPLKRYSVQEGETVDVNEPHEKVILLSLRVAGAVYSRKLVMTR